MPGPKNTFDVGVQFPGCEIIFGSFICNGASAPTQISPGRNAKFTISAPTTGKYTVTLTDGSPAVILGAAAWLAPGEANSTKRAFALNWGVFGIAGFDIQTQSNTGTDANLSGASGEAVLFMMVVSSSSLVNA